MANKCVCGSGFAPNLTGGAYSALQDSVAGLSGPTSKGRKRERGREWKEEGRGGEKAGEMRHLCKGIKALSAPSGILIGSAVFAAFVTSRPRE